MLGIHFVNLVLEKSIAFGSDLHKFVKQVMVYIEISQNITYDKSN